MKDKEKTSCVLILHNIRSAHNVGSMFRTADGAGVEKIILTGYTPVPPKKGALYLSDADKAFQKTALGAEDSVSWEKEPSIGKALVQLQAAGFAVVALEQDTSSMSYRQYRAPSKIALIVGNEVRGLDRKILKRVDAILEIPMYGKKNSLNVSVACGIALYQIIATIGIEGQ